MSRGVGRARNCTRHTSAEASARSDAFTDRVLPRPASPCTHIIAFAATTSARLSRTIIKDSVATTFAPARPR